MKKEINRRGRIRNYSVGVVSAVRRGNPGIGENLHYFLEK
jgi:hypothetical protein